MIFSFQKHIYTKCLFFDFFKNCISIWFYLSFFSHLFRVLFVILILQILYKRTRREGSNINQVSALFKVLASYTLIALYVYIKIHFISNLFLLKRQCCLQLYEIIDIEYRRYVITIRLNFI